MGLRVQTQVSGNAFILHCEGRIVFGDLRERLRAAVREVNEQDPLALVSYNDASS